MTLFDFIIAGVSRRQRIRRQERCDHNALVNESVNVQTAVLLSARVGAYCGLSPSKRGERTVSERLAVTRDRCQGWGQRINREIPALK